MDYEIIQTKPRPQSYHIPCNCSPENTTTHIWLIKHRWVSNIRATDQTVANIILTLECTGCGKVYIDRFTQEEPE